MKKTHVTSSGDTTRYHSYAVGKRMIRFVTFHTDGIGGGDEECPDPGYYWQKKSKTGKAIGKPKGPFGTVGEAITKALAWMGGT